MLTESKYCTPEQGKRLAELGITECAYTWEWDTTSMSFELSTRTYAEQSLLWLKGKQDQEFYPAFDVAELGVALPMEPNSKTHYSYYHRYNWKGHSVGYSQIMGFDHIEIGWYDKEGEARAALLIKLLEEKLITDDEVIARIANSNFKPTNE